MKFKCFQLTVLFCLLYSCSVFSQTKGIDSLKLILANAQEDTNKVNTLNELSFDLYMSFEYQNSLQYAQTALSLAKKIGYPKGEGIALVNVACYYGDQYVIHRNEIDFKKSKAYTDSASVIASQTGDKKLIGFTNHAYAGLDLDKFNYLGALEKYNKALTLYQEAGDKKLSGLIMRTLSMVYMGQANYAEALKYVFRALKYFEETGDEIKIAEAYNTAGDIYTYLGSHSDALKSYNTSLSIYKRKSREFDAAHQFANIADMYLSLKDHRNAMQNYNEAIPVLLKPGAEPWMAPWVFLGMGKCYELKGDSVAALGDIILSKKNYMEAQNYYLRSLKKNDSLHNEVDMIQAYIYLGDVNTKLGKYLQASNWLRESLRLCKIVNAKNLFRDTYLGFSSLYEKTGDIKKAYESYKSFIAYRDSVVNDESIRKSQGYKLQYEFDKKEDSLKQQQLVTETKLTVQKRQRYFYWAGLALLALLSFFVFLNFRNQKKINKLASETHARQQTEMELQSQQAILSERLRISSELHDEVGATLSGIAMYSHLTKGQMKTGQMAEIEKSLNVMQQSSTQMVDKLSDIVWLINPDQDSLQKLVTRLEEYATDMAAIKSMKVKITVPDKIEEINLPIDSRRNIYLFCKEAINNAVKYSNGSLLELTVKEVDNKLEFSVSDNGKGFDAVMVRRGNGLENMQKRADEIGAKLILQSKLNEGAMVSMQCEIGR